MGERWDDSGTSAGVGLRAATPDVPDLFVPDESVDDVGIAMRDLSPGELVHAGNRQLRVRTAVPAGHKIALVDLRAGDSVRKLGHTIGEAITHIEAGEHVHVHNVGVNKERRSTVRSTRIQESSSWHPPVAPTRDHFLGFRRPDGRVGTRNYVGIVPSVNCAATVARLAEKVVS